MSQKASGYERMDGDAYYTPSWVVDALLSVESFHGEILDPGAGEGHILDALRAAGHHDVRGFDINRPVQREDIGQLDFLTAVGSVKNVIGNPPYGVGGRLAVQFIEKSLEATQPRWGKVAMLLRVDFDSANGRRKIFGDHPAFIGKYTLTKRIRWVNLPQAASGPTENHMWAVWDWAKRPDAARTYGYLP